MTGTSTGLSPVERFGREQDACGRGISERTCGERPETPTASGRKAAGNVTMKHPAVMLALALSLIPALPGIGAARGLSVDVWTDRGNDAVYQPGQAIQVKVRASDDAYVLVYEIDAQGYVHTLFPYERSRGLVEGRRTYDVGAGRSDASLVVEGPVGQGYIVSIASLDPFQALPWYLRPADPRAEELGYADAPDDEKEGVTEEGRIVGDPFVAMERIRRDVLGHPEDSGSFATDYSSYFVHHEVRYPRYICNDCHRPGQWAWWDGFDPYYTNCSVFDFRVNYRWAWGPSYWFGNVPYFVYNYRDDCPPGFRSPGHRGWSSWDGQDRWQSLWPGHLTRYKSPAPVGYIPPTKYDNEFRRPVTRDLPPGFLGTTPRDRIDRRGLPLAQPGQGRGGDSGQRTPRYYPRENDTRGRVDRGVERPAPSGETPRGNGTRDVNRGNTDGRRERPAPSGYAPRDDASRGNGGGSEGRRNRDSGDRGASGRAPSDNGPPNVDRAPRQDTPPPPPPKSPENGDSSAGRRRRP